jgi:hypothetical protein
MRASRRTRESLYSTTFFEGRIPLALLSLFVFATASATLDDATTNENLPANTIVGTLSLGVGTGPTNQFNIGFTQKEAHVTLAQAGYWNPTTSTFRKFLVDESGDSLFGGFAGNDTDSAALADFNSATISGWSGMNETQKRRKALETTGYYKLFKMFLDVDGSGSSNAITRESRNGNVSETAWNPSWKDNAHEIHRIDVEGWNGDENGSYDRLSDKYVILPQGASADISQIISKGEPTTTNPVVGQLRDSYNLNYVQQTSSHGGSGYHQDTGAPSRSWSARNANDGAIWQSDYDGTPTEKWNVTYKDNGHKEFKITAVGLSMQLLESLARATATLGSTRIRIGGIIVWQLPRRRPTTSSRTAT